MNSKEFPKKAAAVAVEAAGALTAVMFVVLLMGALAAAPQSHAATKDAAVKQGLAAFDAGDFNAALKKFQPAAKAGNAEAAFWIGRIYEDGLGVKKNTNTAVGWYEKAAKGGRTDAKLQLGEIYFQGTEELQNFKKAAKWLGEAAHDGSVRGQRDLATLYKNGWGVKKSPVYAYAWYEFATSQGDFEARKERDALLKTMSPAQVAQAQKLARKLAPGVFGNGQTDSNGPSATSAQNSNSGAPSA